MTVSMEEKNERRALRKIARLERSRIPDRDKKDEKIRENISAVLKEIIMSGAGENLPRIFTYISFKDEADTRVLIEDLLQKGYEVFCPRIEGKEMTFYKVSDLQDLEENDLGIPEPRKEAEAVPCNRDIFLVPGLLFDRYGQRLGYGGGYYDRYLSRYPAASFGICYHEQVTDDHFINEPWDIPVNKIITDREIISVS